MSQPTKYELLSDGWYDDQLTQNNGDKHLTFIQMVDRGLYDRQVNLDSPQDARLEKTDALNSLFIVKKLFELVGVDETKIQQIEDKLALAILSNGTKAMEANLAMGENKIVNLADATEDKDATNKETVQALISNAIDEASLGDYFKKDGSVTATGNFKMGGKKITNLADPTNPKDAVNKRTVESIITNALNVLSTFFKKDGSVTATGDFRMGGKKITNLADPTNDQDAVTKKYFETHSSAGGGGSVDKGSLSDRDNITNPKEGDIFIVLGHPITKSYVYKESSSEWLQIGEYSNVDYDFVAELSVADGNKTRVFFSDEEYNN